MPQATITRIEHYEDGSVHVKFGKPGRTFQSMEHLRLWADSQLSQETLRAIAVLAAMKKAPALKNAALVNGTRAKIDFDDPTPIEVA